jgi:hypothetical protein
MKVSSVKFYQSVSLPKKGEVFYLNPSQRDGRGCEITFSKGCVVVSSKEWDKDVVVGLANVRMMEVEKGGWLTQEKTIVVKDEPKKPKEPKTTK